MLHEILTQKRKQLGLSLDELVEKSKLPKGTVSKIMSGITPNPQIESLKAIVYALEMTLEDLDDRKSNVLSPEALDLARKYDAIGDEHARNVIRTVVNLEYEHHARPNTLPTSEWLLAHAINAPDAEDQAHSG